ncbi:hypothetical protein, conserved [Plasmodium vivax]|uniref:Merozoite surface protein MSA180 n=1 Tax=Plasmodium vivax (strain Salvador I) TaxID=126793 RepID=A5K7G6_PLAVS|nr:hypothetical protein, conserved [Plasmodium vivax]EDL44725.1 hypothetical protein, conserved [Plasmodium vivax]|eukprot:XP_001614452.1 hypothetical protein [Plasmodium vivax Sal-1]
MPRITPLFLLSILLSFFLFSGQNALTNDDDTNKRATLLALLKNTFIDNTENKKPDDINTALENINNMTLHPTDTDKFNKFLDHFLKFFHIYVSFSDKDKRVLHLSGVLNEVYVDVESLSEENLQKHFDSVHEKGLNLINLIVHSNLVHPKYDETAVQGMEGEEPEQTDGPTEGPGSHGKVDPPQEGDPQEEEGPSQEGHPQEKVDPTQENHPHEKVDPPQEGDPAQESHPHQKDGPAQQDHSQEYAVTPEYADHYHYGGHEEDPEDMDYENGEEYDAQGDPDDHDEHYEFDEHDEHGEHGDYDHDEHGEHDEPYHEEDKKKIKYVGKKLKNLLAMKNIKLNNNSTGEFKVNFYTNYVNYINTPYGAPLLPFHKDSYEYAEVYSGDKLHPKKHGDEQMYYVGEKELIPVHGKGDMQKEGPYDVYKGAMKGIYENIKKKAAKKGGKNGWWGKKKAGKYQIKEDSNGDDDDDEDGDGDGDDDDDDDNGDDDDDEDPDEDDQLQNEPLHKGHGPNKKPKYGHKKKKIHGENVDDEETTDKAPSEKGKKGIDFAYTYYNPYYMFKLGSNMPTGKKAQPSGKGAPAKGGLLKGGKGHDEEEEEVADEEEEEEEEAEVADAEDVADEEDAEEVADEDADVTDGDDAEKQHAKKSAANLFVNTLLELAGYLEPSESKKSELKEDKNSLGQANKSRPIYKKKEMKSRKMKTKKDIVDEKTTEKIKDTMYVKVGQNGTNGFLNFFDFREYAVKENFKDLLKVMETLKVFNITETIIFIQKFTESVCASYCMGITDVLELVNNDMLLYEKMSFHFRKNGMTVTTNSNYEFNGINFESLLALLNINKETIPLTCPCKSYTNNIISYCKQYKSNLKGYFTQSKNSEYLEKFTPYYLLEQLILLEDKLNYIKKNGKISSDTSVKILESKDLHTTAYYHNNRYFPPLKASSASSTAPVSAVGGKSGLNRVGGFGGNGVDGNGVSSHGSNHGGGELADELKYPDVDTLNIYYNASPVNLKSIHDVKNVLIDEVKSKIFYINSYRIGNQFFPTYSNLGKDDHDLEILESANSSKLKVEGRTSKRSPKLGHFVVPKLESVEKHSTGGSGGSDGSDEDSDETTDAGSDGGSDGGSVGGGALAKHKIMGNSDWIPLKSPPNHEDFYNAKKRHTNLLDHEGKQLCEKKMDDSDCVSLKCAFLEKDARAKESGECDKEVVDKHTGDKEASDKQTGEGGETDGADQAESQNNVNESEEHSAESLKLQSKMGEPLSCKKKKAISAKYLIYFFKNVHVWKTGEYCQNVNYIDNWLKKINYNEEIIFQEQLDEDSVVLYFSSNLKDKYKLDMEYFIFLLQKISLIMYVEDLCGIFQIDEMKQNKKIDKHIENPANIHNFMEKHILFSHEQYSKKNKYAKELSIISTSNFFSSKKDIILNSQPYNNIVFNEKEIYESLYVYMEDVLTERMINETWLTPYGFILCKPTLSDANNYKLKISQNEFITKYSRSAIDKYMYYEYRKIGNNIVQHHLDLSPKLSEHLAELKEYRLIIYNDNPSMTNIIITTTVNVLNIAFLQSLLEVILDIRATQQFFSYKGRFIPINAFIILDEGVNYLFFNYVPNENHINYAA